MSAYDTDFYAWTRQQAQALAAKNWSALDVEEAIQRQQRPVLVPEDGGER